MHPNFPTSPISSGIETPPTFSTKKWFQLPQEQTALCQRLAISTEAFQRPWWTFQGGPLRKAWREGNGVDFLWNKQNDQETKKNMGNINKNKVLEMEFVFEQIFCWMLFPCFSSVF